LAGLLGLAALPAFAQQIILTPSNVMGGSACYDGPYNTAGTFPATKAVSQQTGAITTDNQGVDMWLGQNGATTGYFVLDLGTAYTLGQIDLFNTHNDGYNDRGTGAFHVAGANSVASAGSSLGMNLVSPTTILSGNLTFSTGIPADDVFTSANGLNTSTAYRYISFTFDSIAGGAGGGLNEIRVFQIPEPTTTALVGGVAVLVLVMIRRRRQVAVG